MAGQAVYGQPRPPAVCEIKVAGPPVLGGNGSAEDTLRCQASSCLGRPLASQRAGSPWAAHVLWWAGGGCSGQGRQWVLDTGQDGPSSWSGVVCTPAIAAAKTPAKGCPRPCVTTARPPLGLRIRTAEQSPPDDQLELTAAAAVGHRPQAAPCRGAGLALPWTLPRSAARRPKPLGRRWLKVRPSPGDGGGAALRARPAAAGLPERGATCAGGAGCEAAAPPAGRRWELRRAGPGGAAEATGTERGARAGGSSGVSGCCGTAGGVVPRTRAGNVCWRTGRTVAVPP